MAKILLTITSSIYEENNISWLVARIHEISGPGVNCVQ